MSPIFFSVLIGLISSILIYWYWKVNYYFSGLKSIKSPPMKPLVGMALSFTKGTDKFFEVLTNFMEEFNNCAVGFILFECIIVTGDPDLMETICSSSKYIDKATQYRFFHKWLGSGLLTSTNPKWRKHRKMITPAYHFQILEQFIDVFENNGNVMITKFKEQTNKDCLNVYPLVTLCALDIICESAMGTSVNAQNEIDSEYVKAVKTMCKVVMDRSVSPVEVIDFFYYFTKNYREEKKALKVLHDYTMSVIKSKREVLAKNSNHFEEEDEFGKKRRVAFLDLLLKSTVDGRPLTDTEIREEVDTFMFEGHDTTASAISFAIHCLANNKVAQEKALLEQKEIFGNDPNRAITHQDLQDMKYLELVIKETLRLYPSVPFFAREITEDSTINNMHVKKGTQVLLYVFGMQRNPKLYPEPEKFIPERFLEQTGAHPYSYIPFSAGPRNCIGQKFAMLEMKSAISKVLRNFELLPADNEPKIVLLAETILKSGSGVHVKIKDRKWE